MGNPRWRPVKAAPRPCDFGRTSEKPDFACKEADGKPAEGTHRWNTAGGAEVNLCDPHDAEAKRGIGDSASVSKTTYKNRDAVDVKQ